MKFSIKDIPGISALIEDDSPTPSAPQPVHEDVQQQPIVSPIVGAIVSGSQTAMDRQDDAYQRLLGKTDFHAEKPFKVLEKYLTPIASLAIDEKTKFQIAVQQAKAQEGLQSADIMALFEACKITLQQEASLFADAMTKATSIQVEAKKAQAESLSAQIKSIQEQIAQLTEEAFRAQQKIQETQHRFELALQVRQTEIAQEQTKYASLLA